jgi:hypothetical protein
MWLYNPSPPAPLHPDSYRERGEQYQIFLLNVAENVEESDTTMLNLCTDAGNKIN